MEWGSSRARNRRYIRAKNFAVRKDQQPERGRFPVRDLSPRKSEEGELRFDSTADAIETNGCPGHGLRNDSELQGSMVVAQSGNDTYAFAVRKVLSCSGADRFIPDGRRSEGG